MENHLPLLGTSTAIRTVSNVISNYTMNCPKSITNEIDLAQATFWGSKGAKEQIDFAGSVNGKIFFTHKNRNIGL